MLAKFKNIFIFIFLCLLSVHSYSSPDLPSIIYAKVKKIVDGDTVHLYHMDFGVLKVRLADIDAPETKQPYGEIAKNFLKTKIEDKIVTLKKTASDKYGRIVGIIYYKNIEINEDLVINGMAWSYDYYNSRKNIKEAEDYAKQNKIGLWSEDIEAIPPWEWRKTKKEAQK